LVRSQRSRETRRRILGLDRIDPSTGLINKFVFAERLLRMAARSQRMGLQSAVMLIDVTNSAQILRDFGQKSAMELPLRLAARLQSTAREIDSAASLSTGRFGMLIEGPFTDQEAAELGPRIVARCLMPYPGMHADCVAQVRVAYALVPYKGDGTQSLLSRLEEKLNAAARRDDKRAVFMLANFETADSSRTRASKHAQL
jgi:two-component system, sensor histidine kinase LadS